MGKMRYRKLEATDVRGICVKCGINNQVSRGGGKFRPLCQSCHRKRHEMCRSRAPYAKYKEEVCNSCGFVAVHSCQLDVDHIDGNHSNNDPSNLQTLCANCHRLKTYQNRDWK